ncbi:MAG TPA: hypothetical protein VHV49_05335 [Pseudonocardiaceae bacterium]|jgi:hypothetical protein|nr:hypothetical protein [Pseudonocardiaceae bacterium]
MLYLLAAIGVVTIAALLWRALNPDRVSVGARRQVVAPDDDPDFLRRLGEQNQRPEDQDGPDQP